MAHSSGQNVAEQVKHTAVRQTVTGATINCMVALSIYMCASSHRDTFRDIVTIHATGWPTGTLALHQ